MPADRYLRHRQIDGFSQAAVSALKLIVVGAGAIGNEVIKNLVLLGAGQNPEAPIRLYDIDQVEAHNLTRSVLLREADVGRSKAQAVARHAGELDPATNVLPIDGDIAETLSLDAVAQADLVFGCVDNFEARIRINQYCLLTGTAWINTAIDSRYASVEVFPLDADEQPPCYECTLPMSVYQRLAERRSCGGLLKSAREQRVMPTTTLTTSLVAALAVNQALVLTGCDNRTDGPQRAGAIRLFTDSLTGTTTRSEIPAASLCACCDALPWKTELTGPAVDAGDLRRFGPVGQPDPVVLLGDALISRAACKTCGPRPETDRLAGLRAAAVSDTVMICTHCQQASVDIEITDRFALSHLIDICRDRPLPSGWAEIDGKLIALAKPERQT